MPACIVVAFVSTGGGAYEEKLVPKREMKKSRARVQTFDFFFFFLFFLLSSFLSREHRTTGVQKYMNCIL
jgi:hypothetical protein